MKFLNPWIDPRIERVRKAALESYLARRGWLQLSDSQTNFVSFEKPASDNFGPIVNVPQLEHARDYVQRVIEVVSDLARAEDRYAVEVLDDILVETGSPEDKPTHGPAIEPTSAPILPEASAPAHSR